jgi:predicted MFS family arabinose efflux permease
MITTPLAGLVATRLGTRPSLWMGLVVAAVGLVLLLTENLSLVLAGMVLVGVGTFFAQAIGTGFIGRAAQSDRVAASGLYLASYYCGGLAGGAIVGQVFDRVGWTASVATVGVSLSLAAIVGFALRVPEAKR